jgi:acetyl esterase/lipase
MHRFLLTLLTLAIGLTAAPAQKPDEPTYTRRDDVIYGRKHGMALVMDVFTPRAKPNGAGVVYCVSGGWFSAKGGVNPGFYEPLLDRGYTVFAVMHGSQPKFTIPEAVADINRAVRFIRYHAKDYGVDPERIGISGGSAGGHLSMMQATSPMPRDPKAKDPVDRVSAEVQAVGCFFPPTDFLNYGEPGKEALGNNVLAAFRPPFEFWRRDKKTNGLVIITDEKERREIGRRISPVYHVTHDSAPALIFHGDADKLVPIQQAELIITAYEKAGVPCKLVVKEGKGHGWANMVRDVGTIADWFDKYLAKKPAGKK